MKISTKGRYALRLMLDIAAHNTEPVRLKDIAERQGISEKYMEQIVSSLKKAGLLRSVRGAQGGYNLSKHPKEYTVGMILRVTEGDMSPVECLSANGIDCKKANECVTIKLWEKLDNAISGVIDNITLEDMMNWSENASDNYCI